VGWHRQLKSLMSKGGVRRREPLTNCFMEGLLRGQPHSIGEKLARAVADVELPRGGAGACERER
jgi:hypothetical protein